VAKTDFKTADDYVATFAPEVWAILQKVRDAIRRGAPGADEVISYQMPTFRFHGLICHLGAYRKHYSLFGLSAATREVFEEELAPYATSKGTVQFPLDEPVLVRLISALAKQQARENAGGQKQKAGPQRAGR
jgi:uncharacterized protein YdhG (YjbR/CyaY superfamily)